MTDIAEKLRERVREAAQRRYEANWEQTARKGYDRYLDAALADLERYTAARARVEALREVADALCPEASSLRAICGTMGTFIENGKPKERQREKCLPHKMFAAAESQLTALEAEVSEQ